MKTESPPKWLNIPAAIWVVMGLTFIILPLRVLGFGYLPPDDALRYAAKAVSGKSWSDIIVMRPEITVDHNAGWNWFLGFLHNSTGWNAWALVAVSVVNMFLVFAVAPLPWLKRPEGWLAAIALVMVVFPYFADRAFVGRPLFVSMAVTLALLCMWTRRERKKASRKDLLSSVLLFALGTWVHGAWYLLFIIPAVFFLSGAWRKALQLTFCWAGGTIVGTAITGHPWQFLHQSLLIPFVAVMENVPLDSKVGEFQPFNDGYPALLVIGLVLVWRKVKDRPLAVVWRDPVFWLALIGWVLGFRVLRFWLDWGLPALTLWLARQFEELAEKKLTANPKLGLVLSGVAAVVLLGWVGANRNGHWSEFGNWEGLDARRAEHAGWLPNAGGILYCVNLSVFYQTFFQNPHGDWKYILGFEPSFMRSEDWAVYQELWRTKNAVHACAPWVARMKSADRLVLVSGPQPRPTINRLEWKYAAEMTWVGRLARETNGSWALPLTK